MASVLRRTFTHRFAAFHSVPGLPSWHPCARGHGPEFSVTLELGGSRESLRPPGMLGDPEVLRDYETWAERTLNDTLLGEQSLNDVVGAGDLESLARWVWDRWHERIPELRAVAVTESAGGSVAWDGTSMQRGPR